MKYAGSFAQLARFVPAADEEVGGGIEDALDEAHEEANSDDLTARGRGGKSEREECPDELAARYPDGRANLGENELRGELPDDI